MRNNVFTMQNSSYWLLQGEEGSSRWFSKIRKRGKKKLVNVSSTKYMELVDIALNTTPWLRKAEEFGTRVVCWLTSCFLSDSEGSPGTGGASAGMKVAHAFEPPFQMFCRWREPHSQLGQCCAMNWRRHSFVLFVHWAFCTLKLWRLARTKWPICMVQRQWEFWVLRHLQIPGPLDSIGLQAGFRFQ